jgi:Leucine-rich repeat (LRR) protein
MGNKDSKNKSDNSAALDADDLNSENIERYFADAKKAGTLKNIERLDLSQKEFTEVPPQITKLPNLKILHLYDNNLKEMPNFIGELNNLISLSVNENTLGSIPPEIGRLQNLTMLDLRYALDLSLNANSKL